MENVNKLSDKHKKWETKWTKMGLYSELKYIFILVKLYLFEQNIISFGKNIQVKTRGMHTAAMHYKERRALGVCRWTVCMSVFLTDESLYVGLPFGTEIVAIASRWQLDVGTFSYF